MATRRQKGDRKMKMAIQKFTLAVAITLAFSSCEEKSGSKSTSTSLPIPTASGFKDSRDGKAYKTVNIGKRVWMAENLNYEAEGSRCYNDSAAYCKKYGRLYDWETAIKACPAGWHLPSNEEWDRLFYFAGGVSGKKSPYKSMAAGKYLKAKSGWNDYERKSGNGDDRFGFSALPGGNGNPDGTFLNVGDFGSWWCGSEDGTYFAYGRVMGYCYEQANWFYYNESNLYSVRCVQNPSEAEIHDDIEIYNDTEKYDDIPDLLPYTPNPPYSDFMRKKS
jgi:uncharacterized protein (TIGR02145 family)